MRVIAFFVPIAVGILSLVATSVATAQPAAPVGVWRCVVNSSVVSIDLQMQVNPDRTLAGRGTIIYVGTSSVYNVQGYGDWTALPPDASSPNWLYKFRMNPPNHAIFSWFAGPTGTPGNLYNVFQDQNDGSLVETACQRIG